MALLQKLRVFRVHDCFDALRMLDMMWGCGAIHLRTAEMPPAAIGTSVCTHHVFGGPGTKAIVRVEESRAFESQFFTLERQLASVPTSTTAFA